MAGFWAKVLELYGLAWWKVKPLGRKRKKKVFKRRRQQPQAAELEGQFLDEIPVCENCNSDEFMELISFTDKKTGKPRQAWKCQQCQKWIWPAKNGKGQ